MIQVLCTSKNVMLFHSTESIFLHNLLYQNFEMKTVGVQLECFHVKMTVVKELTESHKCNQHISVTDSKKWLNIEG